MAKRKLDLLSPQMYALIFAGLFVAGAFGMTLFSFALTTIGGVSLTVGSTVGAALALAVLYDYFIK